MSAENITKVCQAAGMKVCPQWAAVFAEYLQIKNPLDLVA